ncbi:MAG: acyltransferase family protein [Proteobacteria bacterium]|nr:acyltransferase family protein [Pseudomonadota bacterium]
MSSTREEDRHTVSGSGAGVGSRQAGSDVSEAQAWQRSEATRASAPESKVALQHLEREVEQLLREVEHAPGGTAARRRAVQSVLRLAGGKDTRLSGQARMAQAFVNSREIASTDYYLRQWGLSRSSEGVQDVDEFGLDAVFDARMRPVLDLLHRRYFRVALAGMDNVPSAGGALLVCNHAGMLPWEGLMLKTSLRESRDGALRWLIEDHAFHVPFLGACMSRMGAVRACQQNAERLLRQRHLVAVFPEGIKGITKLYSERHRLERFGRGGYVRLALRTAVPLIPVAIVGGEETYPVLSRLERVSRLLGMPFFPVTPLFPFLGPLGLLPLPARWQIVFGEPMADLQSHDAAAADDAVLVSRLNDKVRTHVQSLVNEAVSRRGNRVFV